MWWVLGSVCGLWLLVRLHRWLAFRSRPDVGDLPSETKLLRLGDGRWLAYDEFGPLDGEPTLYFHGCPSSRLEAGFLEAYAERFGLRLVSPDRPGCGRSDVQEPRRVLDWPEDVRQLSDHLGWVHFGVLCTSGGFPFAAACGFAMPERVSYIVDAAGWVSIRDAREQAGNMALGDRIFSGISVWMPWLLQVPFVLIRYVVVHFGVKGFQRIFRSWQSKADWSVMREPVMGAQLRRLTFESFRQGSWGPTQDALLCFRDWGFSLSDVEVPVYIFQGLEDKMVAPSFSERAHELLPNSTLQLYEGEGHYQMILQYDRALAWVRQHHPASSPRNSNPAQVSV